MNPIRLSEEQSAIVNASGNVVVIAGAGTGKTETLTQRVLHTLTANADYSLRELVVLTFTDKAAGEMRQRIYRGLLQRLVNETDEAARRRWSALCAGFAETHRIETFDAFNHRLLAAYPEFQLVPNFFTPMTDYDERQLQSQMARSFWGWLESLEPDAPEKSDFFGLLEDYDRKQILRLLDILAGEEERHRTRLAVLSDEDDYRTELRALSARFAIQLNRREARRLHRLWGQYQAALQREFPELPPALVAVLHDPDALILRDSAVVTTAGGFRRRWIPAEHRELCLEIEERVFPFLKPWQKAEEQLFKTLEGFAQTEASWEADWRVRSHLARAARLAGWWAQKREEICRREGWLDFTSAHRAALTLLEEHEEVASRLRGGCRFVLVDEFQDTNFSQWRLVAAFSSPENVMLIGDGKQSIYGFRGGDITVFDEVRRDVLNIETPHGLSLSQRATPQLAHFFNEVFSRILPDENDPDREAWEAPFQALHSARIDEAPSDVYVIEAAPEVKATPERESEAPRENAPDTDELFYTEVDAVQPYSYREPPEIELLANATALLLREIQDDADAGEDAATSAELLRPEFASISARLRANEPATIGVLFTSHAAKAVYEAALRRYGVRYASVKGIGFFQSQPVSDAINLLRFFFDVRDDIALAGILRSPFFGVSDLALLELKRVALENGPASFWQALEARCAQTSHGDFALEDDDERVLQRAHALLSRWRERSQVEPMSAILEAASRETEAAFARALRDDAAQLAENWHKILEITREREERGQGSVRALAEYFSEQAQSEEREADADLPEGGAIQLMTVFASKGLGFAMTIVAQMDGGFRFDEELLRRGAVGARDEMLYALNCKDGDGKEQKNLVWEILKENERAQREAEWSRLFYVACTRARDFVLLAMPQAPKAETWAEMVAPFLEGKTRFGLTDLKTRAEQRAQKQRASEIQQEQRVPPAPEILSDLLRPLPQNAVGSEASVTQLSRPTAERSARFGAARWSREHGIVFHRLLRAGVAPDELARIESFASAAGLPRERALILQRQLAAAYSWLQTQNFDLSRAKHEMAFSIPAAIARELRPELEASTQWINGAIDFLAPRGDGWVIVDFKTHAGEAPSDQSQYDAQLRLYRAAAEVSGLRVEECHVLFLDEAGHLTQRQVD